MKYQLMLNYGHDWGRSQYCTTIFVKKEVFMDVLSQLRKDGATIRTETQDTDDDCKIVKAELSGREPFMVGCIYGGDI